MCIYVSNPIIEPAPFFVHAQPVVSPHLSSKAGASAPEFYQEAYDTKNNISFTAAPLNGPILPNGQWGVNSHPSDQIIATDTTLAMGFYGTPGTPQHDIRRRWGRSGWRHLLGRRLCDRHKWPLREDEHERPHHEGVH